MTDAVIYYSNTGESKRVAAYLAEQLGFALTSVSTFCDCRFATAVLVFPVHCQDAPEEVWRLARKLTADNVALVATYGKMSYGNVLHKMQRRCNLNAVAAAYVPTKHAYVNEPPFDDFASLRPIVDKLQAPSPTAVSIPRSRQNAFAQFAPKWRSQVGCKIARDNDKCDSCNVCRDSCRVRAIANGKPNNNCLRCLACVNACPQGALTFTLNRPMRKYLRKPKKTDLVIYV